MKKSSIIELTPLLDVILILLFAFLIIMQGQSNSMDEKFDALEETNMDLMVNIDELESQNAELEKEKSRLEVEVNELREQIWYESLSNTEEKKTLEAATKAFMNIIISEDTDLEELLAKNPDAESALGKVFNSGDTVFELYKYNYIMNRFFFVNVELVGEENRVEINSEPTQLAINRDDAITDISRKEKALKLYDAVKAVIDSRLGGAEMVMVILIVRDPEVYQYAYKIAWDALHELELRSSGYRLYKTSYTYTD